MAEPSGFAAWYGAKLGRFSLLVQAAFWLFGGYAWIPIWYAVSGSQGRFAAWYKVKLGHQLPVSQIALWFLYGFFWIPLWYYLTRNTTPLPADAPAAAAPVPVPMAATVAGTPATPQAPLQDAVPPPVLTTRFMKERLAFIIVVAMLASPFGAKVVNNTGGVLTGLVGGFFWLLLSLLMVFIFGKMLFGVGGMVEYVPEDAEIPGFDWKRFAIEPVRFVGVLLVFGVGIVLIAAVRSCSA